MKTKYYEAMSVASGYRGRIYQYKDDQERTEVVWLSPETYPTEAEALDAAVEWAEDHDMEVTLG